MTRWPATGKTCLQPLELFYDLAVVVLVAQDAHRLAGHLTWPGLGQYAVVFTLVWIAWGNGSLHHELHGRDDARSRSTFLLQILVLVAMGAFIPGAGGDRGAAFAIAAAVLFAILTVLWLLAARGDSPVYRRSSRLFVTGTVVAGLAARPVSALTLSVGLVAVVVGFGAWWTYFDFAGNRQARASRRATVQFILGHLPLAGAIAAMGAAMVSLVDHAHAARTPAATAWVLGAGTAVVLGATMLIAASLQVWQRDRDLYRPLARACAAAAVACIGVAALRPAPFVLGLLLVVLLSMPWVVAVAHRLAIPAEVDA